ncbi:MAG: alpha/beta fold hydrolase [Prevotella sp.]|nr:alpha/beta fold hydrolase [Prevotella sp.]
MENPYVKQFPDLMKGKTLLYVHGFGSSGQSGTVTRLRTVLPNAKVIAPDLPVHPAEAQELLQAICRQEQPQLIVGTSMGGMYTEQLYGFDRICINPALQIADTMQAHGLTGTQTFQNPRQDGVQQFYVDKAMVKEYRQASEQRFAGVTADEQQRVFGLFGDKDDLVDTFDLFHQHYPNAMHFHGEHRMDDRSYMHSVMPVIRWIDDRQEGRELPIIYIGIETLWQQPAADSQARPSAQKAVRQLIENYQVYFVCPAPTSAPHLYAQATAWLEQYINVPAWGHTVFTNQRRLLYGDYLIEAAATKDAMATIIDFGSDTFKTWDDVTEYFSRLGGQ